MKASNFQPEPMLYVRNNGEESFVDRYDSEDFEIRPGEYLPMPIEAARLCLGYGEGDKSRAIARLGWARTAEAYKVAVGRLDKFSFHGTAEEAARGPQGQSHAPLVSSTSSKPSGADEEAGQPGGRPLLGKLARASAAAPA